MTSLFTSGWNLMRKPSSSLAAFIRVSRLPRFQVPGELSLIKMKSFFLATSCFTNALLIVWPFARLSVTHVHCPKTVQDRSCIGVDRSPTGIRCKAFNLCLTYNSIVTRTNEATNLGAINSLLKFQPTGGRTEQTFVLRGIGKIRVGFRSTPHPNFFLTPYHVVHTAFPLK